MVWKGDFRKIVKLPRVHCTPPEMVLDQLPLGGTGKGKDIKLHQWAQEREKTVSYTNEHRK